MAEKTRKAIKCGLIASCAFAWFAITSQMVAAQGAGSALGQNPDTGSNTVYKVGGDVSAPLVIHSVEPEYKDAARNGKVSGNVLVSLLVDAHGNPSHVHVVQGLHMGLDERALEAVRQYKFKPGMRDGKPVRVELTIVVNFHEPAN